MQRKQTAHTVSLYLGIDQANTTKKYSAFPFAPSFNAANILFTRKKESYFALDPPDEDSPPIRLLVVTNRRNDGRLRRKRHQLSGDFHSMAT